DVAKFGLDRPDLACEIQEWNGASHSYSFLFTRSNNRAGLPATMVRARTFFVTTLPAPMIAPSPMVTPHKMTAPDPMEAPCLTTVGITFQSASVCNAPVFVVARGYRSFMKTTW